MVNPLNAPTSDDKLWAGLSYVGIMCCLIGSLIVFFLKKDESSYIKFNALQAIGFGLVWIVLSVGLNFGMMLVSQIPVIGLILGLVGMLIPLGLFGYWIFLMIQAFMGKDVRIPVLADFIDQNLMG